jgi:recombination protein RecA
VDVIVVDSVAALTPQAEIEGDMGDAQMGLQARLMSQAMRKLTAIIGKSRTILIFINQIRMKIGMMFGNPETTTGGNALKFYASVRVDVRKTDTIEGGGKDSDALGNRVRVKVVKNKVAPPFRRAELEIIFGKGVSAVASLLDAAVKHEIIDKKGAWYSYGEEKIGQGRESAREYLETHPDFTTDLERRLRAIIFPGREFPQTVSAKPAVKEETAEPVPSPQEKAAEEEAPSVALETEAVSPQPAPAPRPAARPQVPPPERPGPGRPPGSRRESPNPAPGPVRTGPGRPRKNPDPAEGLF